MVHKMNFPSDQQGIMNRYLREAPNWQSHLYNAQQFILEFANSLAGKDKLIVFGSGWLLDFPLEELSNKFTHITLVDAYHPAQVRHRVKKKHTNVSLLEADVTGNGISLAYDFAEKYSGSPHPGMFTPDISVLIDTLALNHSPSDTSAISLNILSQLDTFLIDYLKKCLTLEEAQIESLRRNIQLQHIRLLRHFSPACLITDTAEIRYPRTRKEGTAATCPLLTIDIPESHSLREWTWIFDTTGSYVPGYNVHLQIKAMIL